MHPEEVCCLNDVTEELKAQGDAVGCDEFFTRDIWDNSKN